MPIEPGDTVTFDYVGRHEDGTVFDTSKREVAEEAGLVQLQLGRNYEPLTVTMGEGQLIEGLEEGILGLAEGDEVTQEVPPEKGYGEWTEERVREITEEFYEQQVGGPLPEVGDELPLDGGGTAEVLEVEPDAITIDFNPDLAGETLFFEIEVLEVE